MKKPFIAKLIFTLLLIQIFLGLFMLFYVFFSIGYKPTSDFMQGFHGVFLNQYGVENPEEWSYYHAGRAFPLYLLSFLFSAISFIFFIKKESTLLRITLILSIIFMLIKGSFSLATILILALTFTKSFRSYFKKDEAESERIN